MEESDAALEELVATRADTAAVQIAVIYGARGELDHAFAWLERSYVQRDSGLFTLRTGRHWAALRPDPRWEPFLRKMNLADDQLP
jgi:hypothetical protein